MNYLAHVFLSGDNKEVQIGNFIGDAIKGKDYENYTYNVKKGVLLHRQIDTFTDAHPIVRQSKKQLSPIFGHYSGVLIDIFYDYFLSIHWAEYSASNLEEFTQDFYKNLLQTTVILPAEIARFKHSLTQNHWFQNYRSLSGLTRVFKGLEKRIIHQVPLSKGVIDLELKHDIFEEQFMSFFPELILFSQNYLNTYQDE